jgi:hypothetical protein
MHYHYELDAAHVRDRGHSFCCVLFHSRQQFIVTLIGSIILKTAIFQLFGRAFIFMMMFDGCNELLMMTEDDNLFVALCCYWQL